MSYPLKRRAAWNPAARMGKAARYAMARLFSGAPRARPFPRRGRRGGHGGRTGGFGATSYRGYPKKTIVTVPRGASNFIADIYRCIHPYHDLYTDTSANGFVDWQYIGNTLYDPDPGVGGQVPLGTGQLSNIYQKYRVFGSSISLHIINLDTDDPIIVYLIPTTTNTAFTSASHKEALQSMPRCKSIMVANANGEKFISNYCDTRTLYNVKDLDSPNYAAAYNANPVNMWYWHIVIHNNSANALNCVWSLRIDYFSEHMSPRLDQFTVA